MSEIQDRLSSIAHSAADKLGLRTYKLHLNLDVLRGDGFLGEFYKISITDQDQNREIKLAVKKALEGARARLENSIQACYRNEILFYTVIHPALQAFQRARGAAEVFDQVPEHLASVADLNLEMICFKDLTADGYVLRQKDLLLDEEHARLIFQVYGQFHAVSFCLRDQDPEQYERLTRDLVHIWAEMGAREGFSSFMGHVLKEAWQALDGEVDEGLRSKLKAYAEGSKEMFLEALRYDGEHFGILHGDCWSNNMMFKYQDESLARMKLLDFQLVSSGTPVFDLSYFFYTGGSKQLFDKLEHFLDIYHESFSKTAKVLGGSPDELFPREALSADWKKYSKFGMMLGLMLTKVKLMSKESAEEIVKNANRDTPEENIEVKVDGEIFKKRAGDIVRHMNEINAL